MKKHIGHFTAFTVIAFLNACGVETTDGSACSKGCIGEGQIAAVSGTTAEITFKDGESGQSYVIVPYVLGDVETVTGAATNEDPKTLTVSIVKDTSSASTAEASEEEQTLQVVEAQMAGGGSPAEDALQREALRKSYDHNLRTLWNRFDSRLGALQEPGFWQLVEQVERQRKDLYPKTYPALVGMDDDSAVGNAFRRKILKRQLGLAMDGQTKFKAPFLHGDEACPEEIIRPDTEEPFEENDVTTHDEGDYCIVVIKDGVLVTEPNVDRIKTSITTALQTYKQVYDDDFSTHGYDDYEFKPIFIIAPFDDEEVWSQEKDYQNQGVFLGELSSIHNQPTLAFPADYTVVDVEEAVANEAFHSTIAHELQHAILNYYRVWLPDEEAQETATIDEGIAHFMEDLMGYGELNFPYFAKLFLQSFPAAPDPVLYNSDLARVTDSVRGGAHALIYYLVSQAGGVDFTDGTVDVTTGKSAGLSFLRSFVKGTVRGPEGLASAMKTASWTETMGGFYGALVVDGTEDIEIDAAFKTMDPDTAIVATNGEDNKQFGMKFNGFGGLDDMKDVLSSYTDSGSEDLEGDQEVSFYQPLPFRHTLSGSGDTITLTFAEAYTNVGFVAVRVE